MSYWQDVKQSQTRQAWFGPEELIPSFKEYALSVFDANAEEYLIETNRSPQEFIHFPSTPRITVKLSERDSYLRAIGWNGHKRTPGGRYEKV